MFDFIFSFLLKSPNNLFDTELRIEKEIVWCMETILSFISPQFLFLNEYHLFYPFIGFSVGHKIRQLHPLRKSKTSY